MSFNDYLQMGFFLLALMVLVKPLGSYMARVYEGRPAGLNVWLAPLERMIYRFAGIRIDEGMTWQSYAVAMMLFNLLGIAVLIVFQRCQHILPFNPMPAVSLDSAINTAISFATNTDWQGYAGESTMSYVTQMLGLTVQNFLSAATGMAIVIALIRGFTQKQMPTIGNFWVDLVRSTLYILLPLALVFAVILVAQGVPQTFKANVTVNVLQPGKDSTGKIIDTQSIVTGPIASQITIKQLGTNGGGFFNANSAHPYENPTPLTNFLELLTIVLIPAAFCYTFGYLVKDRRQGWTIFAAMLLIFIPFLWACASIEQKGNPLIDKLGIDQHSSDAQSGGNMEGKEVRLGAINSALWAVSTTAASNGSVNAMHDSFMPLSGLIQMCLIQLGEVIFGGVGSGLYGMIAFVIVAVFIAGLMIGRTPEYLGKKIEAFEIQMGAVVALIPHIFILIPMSFALLLAAGKAGIFNPGPHGFSEVLYAFSSAANNNGSAFAGLSANTAFYNGMLALSMFFGRYAVAIAMLAVAGSLSAKKIVPPSQGTLPTHTPLFIFFLALIIIIMGALAFIPSLALGPIVEHLIMVKG